MKRVEGHMAGMIGCIIGICRKGYAIDPPILSKGETWLMNDIPENCSDVSDALKDCHDHMRKSSYNEMYKHVSGSKEYNYRYSDMNEAWHWGVFHRDGIVQGWFHHKDGEDKKSGEFWIVDRSVITNPLKDDEWRVMALGEELPVQSSLEKAWELINEKTLESFKENGGVSAMLMLEMTWAENGKRFLNFEELRDMAYLQGWKVVKPQKAA